MRWEMFKAGSLGILKDTPINCLLVPWTAPRTSNLERIVSEAHAGGIATLALLQPESGGVSGAKAALQMRMDGVALEGDWLPSNVDAVRAAVGPSLLVVELSTRARMRFRSAEPILGTYQGVWPGIHIVDSSGNAEASATGSNWIYTNSGFLHAARAMTKSSIWISVRPPPDTAVSTTQYLQAIADCETVAAHWVITLDPSLSASIERSDPSALKTWAELARMLQFFVTNQRWQAYHSWSKLIVIQGPAQGALLTGGIADMIGASHTPFQILPPAELTPGSLNAKSVVLNVSHQALTTAQQKIVNDYAKGGGVVFNPPTAWNRIASASGSRVILDHKDAKQLGSAWQDLVQMIRQRPLGLSIFNVPSILFNLLENNSGNQLALELTSYADYPSENVTVHLAGKWRTVRLVEPDKPPRLLQTYPVDIGTGIDIDQIGTVAVLEAEHE